MNSGVQESVNEMNMVGMVEGLEIGGKPVGLWNYKSAALVRGALEWLAGFGDPVRVAALTDADWTAWVENTRWCILRWPTSAGGRGGGR